MYVYSKIALYQISIQYTMDYIDTKSVPPQFCYCVIKEPFVEHLLDNSIKKHHTT